MDFVLIIRKLSTSLVRMVLSLLLILLLFLHFWNFTPIGYLGGVMDDVFEHADPISKDAFAQTVLSVCDKTGDSLTGALLGRVQDIAGEKGGEDVDFSDEALGLMMDLCTKKETLAEAREDCDWLKSFPSATSLPADRDSLFDSVDDLESACDAIESEEFAEICEPLKVFGSGGQMAEVITTLKEGCSKYKQGGSGENAVKALITGIAGSVLGQDLGSIGDLLPEDAGGPSLKKAFSILDTALTALSTLKEFLVLHMGAILLLIGLIVLLNKNHLNYAIKKIAFGMLGPTVIILLPYAALQLYLSLVEVDTSGLFLALQGTTEFTANIGSVIPSLLPFLLIRTYTMSLIIAAMGLALLGLLVRVIGLAVLKRTKGEKKEEKKPEEKKTEKEEKGKKPVEKKEKKGLFSKVLPKLKKQEEKKEKPAEEKKEEPKIPKPKDEGKRKEKEKLEKSAPKEKKEKPKPKEGKKAK